MYYNITETNNNNNNDDNVFFNISNSEMYDEDDEDYQQLPTYFNMSEYGNANQSTSLNYNNTLSNCITWKCNAFLIIIFVFYSIFNQLILYTF